MRISLNIAASFLSLIILSSSCKKDNTPSGGATLQGPPPAYNNVYGVLISQKSVNYYSFFSDTSYAAAAIFYTAAQPGSSPASTASVTSASLNNKVLYLYSPGTGEFVYEDTVSNPNLSNVIWQIQGLGVIPSFTVSPSISYPSYAGYNLLPDTINIGQSEGTAFHLTGVSSADSLYIEISSGSGDYETPHMAATTTSYTIAQSNVANLTLTNSGNLSVSYEKISIQNIGGKNFVFTKSFQFNKNVVLISR